MDLKKSYYNSEGIELNILQMVDQEPEWAANRIQEGEKSGIKAIKQQAEIDELKEENSDLHMKYEAMAEENAGLRHKIKLLQKFEGMYLGE